jgi:hypothetical protein
VRKAYVGHEVQDGISGHGIQSPLANRVKKSIPTARTNGSAKGSSIIGWSHLVAAARNPTTIVAVAPTPTVAEHETSWCVRVAGIREYTDESTSSV